MSGEKRMRRGTTEPIREGEEIATLKWYPPAVPKGLHFKGTLAYVKAQEDIG